MGLDINTVLFFIDARKRGVSLGEMLTLGRQQVNVYPRKMTQILNKHGLSGDEYLRKANTQFAEPCLEALGASRVYSLDASDFEGADFVHNLNEPPPQQSDYSQLWKDSAANASKDAVKTPTKLQTLFPGLAR